MFDKLGIIFSAFWQIMRMFNSGTIKAGFRPQMRKSAVDILAGTINHEIIKQFARLFHIKYYIVNFNSF